MKKLILLISLILVLVNVQAQQNIRGYMVEAFTKLEAKRAFVIDLDTFYATTQLNGLDTILVSLNYVTQQLATKENILTKGNLTAGSTKVTIGGTGTNALIGAGASVDVNEANLTLSNIGGAVTDSQVPNTISLDNITQITNRSHTNLSNIGNNSHSQIDAYITSDTPEVFEASIPNDGDTSVTLPFVLKPTSLVFINYSLLPSQFWEGESTNLLAITVPLKKYDYITINKN